jgi:hypothetical protein
MIRKTCSTTLGLHRGVRVGQSKVSDGLTKNLSRRMLISITSFLVAASITLSLISSETENVSGGKGPLQRAGVPGACYYYDHT